MATTPQTVHEEHTGAPSELQNKVDPHLARETLAELRALHVLVDEPLHARQAMRVPRHPERAPITGGHALPVETGSHRGLKTQQTSDDRLEQPRVDVVDEAAHALPVITGRHPA